MRVLIFGRCYGQGSDADNSYTGYSIKYRGKWYYVKIGGGFEYDG